jgi:drug/metabolite transporter (DMT)-like permease
VIWLFALSRVELSFAYPFVGLSFILMMFASSWFFAENISPLRIAGTLVIGLGVFIVSRS